MDIVRYLDKPTAIVGTTGAGKTFTAKGAVERLLAASRRVIIIDPTGAWWGLRSGVGGSQSGGFPVHIFGGSHADIDIEPNAEAGKALALALAERDVQAIIDTSEMSGGEKNRFLTPFLETLYAKNKAALHLIVDEADEIAAQRLADGEQRLFGAFDKIVRRGRIKGFRPLMITQRPAVLHKNVLSQIGTLIALKLTSPQDRKAIEDWVKGNADADQAKAVMTSLPTLKRGEGWVWSPADDVLERVHFPTIGTFDSSRTPADGETVTAPALTAVDVAALRKAMAIASPPSGGTSGGRVDWAEKEAAAEKRGYERGFLDGIAKGEIDLLARTKRVLISVLDNEILAGSPSGKATGFGPVTAGSNPAPAAIHPETFDAIKRSMQDAKAVVVDTLSLNVETTLGAEHKPLAVLVASYPAGYTEAQWASLAGFKRTGGTWSTYKSRLRSKGMIEQRGRLWFASEDASAHLGYAVPPEPGNPRDRLALWKSKVPGVGPMLDCLYANFPTLLSKAAIANAIGMAASGGTFSTYLSRLRSNELIEEPVRGSYRLSPVIMELK